LVLVEDARKDLLIALKVDPKTEEVKKEPSRLEKICNFTLKVNLVKQEVYRDLNIAGS